MPPPVTTTSTSLQTPPQALYELRNTFEHQDEHSAVTAASSLRSGWPGTSEAEAVPHGHYTSTRPHSSTTTPMQKLAIPQRLEQHLILACTLFPPISTCKHLPAANIAPSSLSEVALYRNG